MFLPFSKASRSHDHPVTPADHHRLDVTKATLPPGRWIEQGNERLESCQTPDFTVHFLVVEAGY